MNAPSKAAVYRTAGVPTDEFVLQVVNSVQSPVFVKDEQLHFVLTNDAFCALVGRPNDSLLGLTDYDIVPREQAAFFQEIDRKVLATGAPYETEEMLTSAGGAEFWLFTRKSMVKVASGERYLVGIISDITERKRMEKDLLAAKLQAEDANRAKSMFLANMSHELRTPLNAVIGFAEIIKNEMLGAINEPRYRDYAGDIHNSGKSLLQLINDILDMTKVEAGTYQLREDVCDVAKIVGDAVASVHNLAIQNELTIDVSVPDDMPFLFADARCVRQALVNFLSNGLKFTPKGGSVAACARLDPDGAIAIAVVDTGIGMAQDDIPQALAPFHQLEGSHGRKYEGTGLGLSLTKAMLELHEGTLQVDSKLGVGTTVTAYFPPRRTIYR
ncbi:MAG TPA: ATP-binding protein [Dongiaceae bacterium]|nr:ATP-binding protein [Dongiaceae bacterium]